MTIGRTWRQVQLLHFINLRISRFARTKEREHVLAPKALAQVRLLLHLAGDPPPLYVAERAGWLRYARYLALPEGEGEVDREAAVELLAPVYADDPGSVPGGVRDYFEVREGHELVGRYLESSDPGDLAAASTRIRGFLAGAPSTPARGVHRCTLLLALHHHYTLTGDPAALREAVELGRSGLPDVPGTYVRRPAYLTGLGSAVRSLALEEADPAPLEEAERLVRTAVATAEPDDPRRAEYFNRLGGVLNSRFDLTGDTDALLEADRAIGTAVAIAPAGEGGRGPYLANRFHILRELVRATGDGRPLREAVDEMWEAAAGRPEDLTDLSNATVALLGEDVHPEVTEQALRLMRRLAEAAPAGGTERIVRLSNLAEALRLASGQSVGREPDLHLLDRTIGVLREALAETSPDHSLRPMLMATLSGCLQSRHAATGQREALVEAAAFFAARTPEQMSVRGSALWLLARHTGDPDAAREAARLFRAALAGRGPGAEYGPGAEGGPGMQSGPGAEDGPSVKYGPGAQVSPGLGYGPGVQGDPGVQDDLGRLSLALQEVFTLTGDEAALADAVRAGREAVERSAPEGRTDHLGTLALALLSLAELSGEGEYAVEAAALGRRLVAGTTGGARTRALGNLGIALRAVHELTGDGVALAEAVKAGREAAADPAPPPHERCGHLGNLCLALRRLHEHTGERAPLAEAVKAGREAVALAPAGHPGRALCLSGLGMAARRMFEATGDSGALDEAVRVLREAVAAIAPGHRDRALLLDTLGTALQDKATRTGDPAALAEALAAGQEAVDATPPVHPDRAGRLANLGLGLSRLFELTGEPDAAERWVATGRLAVAAALPGHPGRAGMLSGLGTALTLLAGLTGDARLLDEAVRTGREAVDATPPGHPWRASTQVNLGSSLARRYASGDPGALAEARATFAEAADQAAAPYVRMRACQGLGRLETEGGDHRAALAAYEDAVALLPMLTPRWLSRADREHGLGEEAGLAAEAASAALSAGRPRRAVELLEQARGVLLGEAMDARGGMGELHGRAPDLAGRVAALREALDSPDRARPGQAPGPDPGARRQRLAREWDEVLEAVRALPGLERFLSPPAADELRRQAADGPVVMVNVSRFRCDALILTDETRVVELPSLSAAAVREQAARLAAASRGGAAGPAVRPSQHGADHGVGGGHLRGRGRGRALQEAGDHGGDHLDMTDLLGRDVHDQVLVLAGHPAVPALEQVLHGDGHLAVGAADQLLELVGVDRVGLFRLGLELQVLGVQEHRPLLGSGPGRSRPGPPTACRRKDTTPLVSSAGGTCESHQNHQEGRSSNTPTFTAHIVKSLSQPHSVPFDAPGRLVDPCPCPWSRLLPARSSYEALNHVLGLSAVERTGGMVAASCGNHVAALVWVRPADSGCG